MRAVKTGQWNPGGRGSLMFGLLSMALLSGCGSGEEQAAEARPVRTVVVESRDANGSSVLVGRVQAQTEVNQAFRLDGQLIERTVDIGDRVRAGQLLARLDSQNEESGLNAAQAQRIAAQVQLDDARNNFNRMRDLVADNAVSRAAYDNAVAVLKTAEAQLKASESQLTLAGNRLGFTRLLADVSGVVTARGAEVGEVVPAGRMVVQIAEIGARDAVFDVPAQIMDGATKSGDSIQVWLTSDPAVKATGRVRDVSPRADPVTGTFQVRIRLVNAPEAMRLGSTVTGRLKLSQAGGIDIPAMALFRTNNQPAVWVVDPATMTVSARNIEIRANDSNVVRVASGLKAGETVVTAGVQALRPGQKVRLLETAKP